MQPLKYTELLGRVTASQLPGVLWMIMDTGRYRNSLPRLGLDVHRRQAVVTSFLWRKTTCIYCKRPHMHALEQNEFSIHV
jgi:hypothetical protein